MSLLDLIFGCLSCVYLSGSLVHRPRMRGPSRTISSLTISSLYFCFFLFCVSSKSVLYFSSKKKKEIPFLYKMDPKMRVHSRVNGYFRKWIGSDFVENYCFFFFKGEGRPSATMRVTFKLSQIILQVHCHRTVESGYRRITFNFREWARYFRKWTTRRR